MTDSDEMRKVLFELQSNVKELRKENKNNDALFKQTAESLVEMQKCLSSIKLKVERSAIEQIGFMEYQKTRVMNCDKIHADFEQRLRDHPPELRCAHEKRLASIEEAIKEMPSRQELTNISNDIDVIFKLIDRITPLLYKILGAVLVISILVPPVISTFLAYIMKKIGS